MPVLKYLADTNVVSDWMAGAEPVVKWLSIHREAIAISTLTLAELRRGIELKPEGKARRRLERLYEFLMEDSYMKKRKCTYCSTELVPGFVAQTTNSSPAPLTWFKGKFEGEGKQLKAMADGNDRYPVVFYRCPTCATASSCSRTTRTTSRSDNCGSRIESLTLD